MMTLRIIAVSLCCVLFVFTPLAESAMNTIRIGSRLELFVDHYLIESLEGTQLKLHAPRMMPLSNNPIKGSYMSIIKDSDLYRAYYREMIPGYKGKTYSGNPGEMTCYAESRDGVNWVKPSLGLFEVGGSRANNVILTGSHPYSHNFTPFIDKRPSVPRERRFKALAGVEKKGGLCAFVSEDGIHWQRWRDEPVLPRPKGKAFDSQNVSFWSEAEGCYVAYCRTWKTPHGKLRTISRATSPDYLNWTELKSLHPNVAGEHLYTSGTHPYFRAPHIYIALPTRFMPGRGSSTDIMFMSARGDNPYKRNFMEAFIRPGLDPGAWGNRSNYAAWGVVPTSTREMSIYMRDRRFVLRTDGFVSVNADYREGEMRTKPFIFTGKQLVVNFSTSAAGSLRVEVLSEAGAPIPGYTLDDSSGIVGDSLERVVTWKSGDDVGKLSGTPVRLRFVMQDADLYSIRFK
jgi:hypothetical protein